MIAKETIAELRRVLQGAPLPAVQVREVIASDAACALREVVVGSGLDPFFVGDRGRYLRNDRFVDEALFAALRGLVEELVEARLAARPAWAIWTRLAHGDYALPRDDHAIWTARPSHLELTLDLSAAACTGEAHIVYTGATGAIAFEQIPRSAIVVDRRRGPLSRHERYLNLRVGGAELFRLRLAWDVAGGGSP